MQDRIFATASKITFDCVTLSGTIYLGFHSLKLIYLITSSKCSLQYVGKADQKIYERYKTERHIHVSKPKKICFYWIVSNHSHKKLFKNAPHTVSLLEKLDGNERTPRVALDVSITKRKLK